MSIEESDPFAEAVGRLSDEGLALEISGRTFRIVDPVRGDAGAAALRLLGMVQMAAPVAIATHGATQVAAAVWIPPRLFVVRWSRNRWVVGYRLASGSRPNDYVRSEGRNRYYRARREAFGPVGRMLEKMWADALWQLKLQAELEQSRRGPQPRHRRRKP